MFTWNLENVRSVDVRILSHCQGFFWLRFAVGLGLLLLIILFIVACCCCFYCWFVLGNLLSNNLTLLINQLLNLLDNLIPSLAYALTDFLERLYSLLNRLFRILILRVLVVRFNLFPGNRKPSIARLHSLTYFFINLLKPKGILRIYHNPRTVLDPVLNNGLRRHIKLSQNRTDSVKLDIIVVGDGLPESLEY